MPCCVFSVQFKATAPGHGWHLVLNVRVWLPGEPGPEPCEYSLRGEVLKPATELAMKKSAICLRASRPVGLFPFRCCSRIRLSNSSLKALKREGERNSETACQTLQTELSDRGTLCSMPKQAINNCFERFIGFIKPDAVQNQSMDSTDALGIKSWGHAS